jgi:hypothetical protein
VFVFVFIAQFWILLWKCSVRSQRKKFIFYPNIGRTLFLSKLGHKIRIVDVRPLFEIKDAASFISNKRRASCIRWKTVVWDWELSRWGVASFEGFPRELPVQSTPTSKLSDSLPSWPIDIGANEIPPPFYWFNWFNSNFKATLHFQFKALLQTSTEAVLPFHPLSSLTFSLQSFRKKKICYAEKIQRREPEFRADFISIRHISTSSKIDMKSKFPTCRKKHGERSIGRRCRQNKRWFRGKLMNYSLFPADFDKIYLSMGKKLAFAD